MNIFQVLNQGKSRLHEPSLSAMLGFLFDSNKEHGLGDVVIRKFLEAIDPIRFKEILDMEFIDSQVSLEEPYELNGKRNDVDIQILILKSVNKQKTEIHRIIIENKIKVGAANPKQLNEYYKAVLNDEPDLAEFTIVFITPNITNKLLTAEFDNLQLIHESHGKFWLYWSSGDLCIAKILKETLTQELSGEINPINEYMRHTLKAFIRHSLLSTEPNVYKSLRTGEDIGEIIDEAVITLSNGQKYTVIRRDSTQIQVKNVDGDKEVAKDILLQYMKENAFPPEYTTGNTRTIGKKFFSWWHQNASTTSSH